MALKETLDKHKEYMKKWRRANTEKIKLASKKYYLKNKDRILEYNREYMKTYDKEKVKSALKKYYQNNKRTIAEKQKIHRLNKKADRDVKFNDKLSVLKNDLDSLDLSKLNKREAKMFLIIKDKAITKIQFSTYRKYVDNLINKYR